MKIIIVGGTWDKNGGKPSGLIRKLESALARKGEYEVLRSVNGGNYDELQGILDSTPDYDVVFWFANVVDNSLEKIRDVKSVAPHTLLVTSKRNDYVFDENGRQTYHRKYDFEELIQRALAQKANLCFEFCKGEREWGTKFGIRVFDPLGCLWYEGFDINAAAGATYKRLKYLASVTRKGSISVGEAPDGIEFTEEDYRFLDFVKSSADTFHKLMMLPEHVDRFVGNASMRGNHLSFSEPTRCMNGFPSIRKKGTVLISRRNVDKTGISLKDFVPCHLGDDSEVCYFGEKKPSVDAPVQLQLFNRLPNIDYILHGHCYADGAPMTGSAVPCGALEEIDEVMDCIRRNYNEGSDFIVLNLKGHGCLIMAGKERLEDMKTVQFSTRPVPELMFASVSIELEADNTERE